MSYNSEGNEEQGRVSLLFLQPPHCLGLVHGVFPILRDLEDCERLAKDSGEEIFEMSSLAEIQEAIEKLASEDRARLREWLDAQDVEETDELLAAIDEGIRSAETERTFSLEEVRAEIKKWATKSV